MMNRDQENIVVSDELGASNVSDSDDSDDSDGNCESYMTHRTLSKRVSCSGPNPV